MGTVMLKKDTKIKLTKIAADLQKQKGERVDFDETISNLIDMYYKKNLDWNKFDMFCQPLKNVSEDELMKELYKGRMEDEKKFRLN
jgi:hypothetical protein